MSEIDNKRTETLHNGDVIHNFKPSARSWGWNVLNMNKKDSFSVELMAIGMGVEDGHFIRLRDNVFHLVESIKYSDNPKDLFTAIITGTYEKQYE